MLTGAKNTALKIEDRAEVDELRRQFDAELKQSSCFADECPEELRSAIHYSLLSPGKRLRPLLTLLAAKSCGGNYRQAMPAAIAVEMFHVSTLIQDDLPSMDDDEMRRGQPASHKKFGEALAVLAANTIFAQSFDLLCRDIADALMARDCCLELSSVARPEAIAGGQFEDLQLSQNADITCQQLESIFKRKTGLLMGAAARLGGIVAGASKPALDELYQFGENLGIAFQIVDDLIDSDSKTESTNQRREVYYSDVVDANSARARVEELTGSALDRLDELKSVRSNFELFAKMAVNRIH